ncbi:MAG: FAD-linked oxidase C-terminal domain-containing protein, partial [Pseudomonadota bacterium]
DFWRLRETIAEAEKVDGPAIKHDISVPVSAMPRFVEAVGGEIERRWPGASMIAFGHLGDGNIHFNVRSDSRLDRDTLMALGPEITAFVYGEIARAGGSISAEHGIGTAKAGALANSGDAGKLAAMRAIKAALDPKGIMNPGKVLP